MTYITNGERWQITRGKINKVIKVSYTDLLADTELTYTSGESGTVTAGDPYPTTEGNWFEVAEEAASDQHITTAGGVKLYEAGPQFSTRARAVAAWARMVARSETPPVGTVWTFDGVSIEYDGSTTAISDFSGWKPAGDVTPFHFGAVGDGTTDDRAAFAAMNAYGGLVYLCKPPTRWNVSTGIDLNNVAVYPDPRALWDNLTDGGLITWTDEFGGYAFDGGMINTRRANIWRLADRVFVGSAADEYAGNTSATPDGGTSFWSNASSNAGYLPINGQFVCIANHTPYGVVSLARGADVNTESPIAFGAGVVSDTAGKSGWGFIAEIIRDGGSNVYGVEIGAKDKGGSYTTLNAYNTGSGVFGFWMAGGGDSNNGGGATRPANAPMVILKNQQSGLAGGGWATGIVVKSDAIDGTDGSASSTGYGAALSMARRHGIEWGAPTVGGLPTGSFGARILSSVVDANNAVQVNFVNDGVQAEDRSGNIYFKIEDGGNDYLTLRSGSGLARVSGRGTSTDVDILLEPKGAGRIRMGSHSAIGAETVTGFIEIKDSGGTVRKLAVVS